MVQVAGWIGPVLALAGLACGVLLHHAWTVRAARARRRIPRHWPLDPRPMANSDERRVWRWLARVFLEHHIMVKVPVTRFTMPRPGEDGAHWHQLLNSVYCTFTLCSPDGRVIGCIDVPGPRGISRSNRLLKLSLLSQCGVCYRVVHPASLPNPAELLADFLGDEAQQPPSTRNVVAISAAQEKLKAAVDRQRHRRQAVPVPDTDAPSTGFRESDLAPGAWQQADSFIAPLDSRMAGLG
jgi:hypothetical protein